MKTRWPLFIILAISVCFACNGCSTNADNAVEYDFTDISWIRQAEHDVETIRFNSDGSFTYSCACGNPVNDADLCEGYSYDEKTKTITLDYIEITEEAVSKVKIEKCSENTFILNFEGEIRIFEKAKRTNN